MAKPVFISFSASVDFILDGPAPLGSEWHGAEDVGIYARGPMSHLYSGTHEQNYIAHLAMYAACVGPYDTEDHCACASDPQSCGANGIQTKLSICLMMFVLIVKCLFL